MTFSSLPWWGWLLTSGVLWFIAQLNEDDHPLIWGVFLLGSLFAFIIGLVRLVKAIWFA
jgi:hypothetical protein